MESKVNKNKLSSYFDLPKFGMTQRLERFTKEDELWDTKLKVVNPNHVFGIEIEMENIQQNGSAPRYETYWNITNDGSLRNHGIELVSEPLKAFQIEKAIKQIKALNPKWEPDFSERTSTHVHMNARDLTMDQIYALTLVYTSIEKVLFKWVGHNRDINIFCVPIHQTDFFKKFKAIVEDSANIPSSWQKYTAFNLCPLSSKGTIEFRHLYGTWNEETIVQWINFISCLKLYVKRYSLDYIKERLLNLNSDSTYIDYIQEIFNDHSNVLLKAINEPIETLLEDTITYCKLGCLVLPKVEPTLENLTQAGRRIWADIEATRIRPPTTQEDAEVEPNLTQAPQVNRDNQIQTGVYVLDTGQRIQIPFTIYPNGATASRFNWDLNQILVWLREQHSFERQSPNNRVRIRQAWEEYVGQPRPVTQPTPVNLTTNL